MASDVIITDAEGITKVTLAGTVARGAPVAHNATNWVNANASDAATNLYAQYIAMESGISGDEIQVCKGCTFYDPDAPYTANLPLYVSATAGALTHTRPATAADVIQNVGRGIDTYRARIDIKAPHELEVFIPCGGFDTSGEAGIGVIDSSWVGVGLDTQNEDVYFAGRFPSNVISVDLARVIFDNNGETTSTISASLIVAADGASNVGDTGTAHAAAAPTGQANNIMAYSDVTAMFDADALKAGYTFVVAVTANGASAGENICVGLYLRYTVV